MAPLSAPPAAALAQPARAGQAVSVSELNRLVAGLLERSIAPLWVAGEVSNFTRAASGHWYFTLKDAGAQVRAVMFRGRNQYAEFQPREGDRIEARATVSLYEQRGDFQLGVEAIRRAGAGDLYQAFLRLKDKLAREGLFDAARKRALPSPIGRIGVVTSPQAAALRDVLTTLARRAPHLPVVIYPTPVQGAEAPARIVAALAAAAARAECEVILLVRGGGALEDLWAFNDERVARAVAASPIPVVAGVGHETDFTIADFVADVRAPTPTGAATLVSPDPAEQRARLRGAAARLGAAWQRRLDRLDQHVDSAQRLLRSPIEQWRAKRQRLDALAHRLDAAFGRREALAASRLGAASARLRAPRIDTPAARLRALARALARATAQQAQARAQRFGTAAAALELVSPRAVLARGYAIVRDEAGAIVRASAQAPAGSQVRIELAAGALRAQVLQAEAAPGPPADAPGAPDGR